MEQILAYLEAHPLLTAWVVVPLLGALANAIWKPRSPDDYAKLGPRLGGFLKLLASVFPDPRGSIQGLNGIVTGTSIPAADLQRAITTAAMKSDPKFAPEVQPPMPPDSPL